MPIGEPRLREGLLKETDADFCVVRTRPAAVYRGNPFQIEIGIAYRDAAGADDSRPGQPGKRRCLVSRADEPVHLLRFANRVPLLYDQAGCGIAKAVVQTNWRAYGLQQTKGALPLAPMAIVVHVASVWVPFTSEAKEAIASYPEILKEIRLGLQQCGRQLAGHLHQQQRLKGEHAKRTHIEKYLPHVALALQEILELDDQQRERTSERLDDLLRLREKRDDKHEP